MSTTARFDSGTAVVTGAGSGIGEGFARHLASRGMTVVVADIDLERADAVVRDIADAGGNAHSFEVDVRSYESVTALADYVFGTFGTVDFLLNNAGIETGGLLWEVPVERWDLTMAVNVTGVFHGIRAFLPRMIQSKRPAVVANMSSIGGISTSVLQAPYIVSKHSVLALTECLHQEVALVGAPIQVSAILPAQVRSRIFSDAQSTSSPVDPMTQRVFEWMQSVNESDSAMDALVAAAHMTDQIESGKFWVFSDEGVGNGAAIARGDHLRNLTPPIDPRAVFQQLGVEL